MLSVYIYIYIYILQDRHVWLRSCFPEIGLKGMGKDSGSFCEHMSGEVCPIGLSFGQWFEQAKGEVRVCL